MEADTPISRSSRSHHSSSTPSDKHDENSTLSVSDMLSMSPLELLTYSHDTDSCLSLPLSPTVRTDVHPLQYAYLASIASTDLNNTDITMIGDKVSQVQGSLCAWLDESQFQAETGRDNAADTSSPSSSSSSISLDSSVSATVDTAHTHNPDNRPLINTSTGNARGCYSFIRHAAGDACLTAEANAASKHHLFTSLTSVSAVPDPPFAPVHPHPRLRPMALQNHRGAPMLLLPLPARQYAALAHISRSTRLTPVMPQDRVMACPTEGLCVGEIEGNNVACQLNVGTGLGLLSSHSTSLPYLYAVEYAHAYMKEILLRGQPFMRLRKKSVAGQHSVRCILLRVAKDPPDFSVIHMYKSLCVRVVGAEAKFRFPMAARADDQYCDYRTFFYDDAPMHPLNKESIYDLDARTRCTVSGVSVAKYLVINSYKYEYARSIPAESIVAVTYGMQNCRPHDILGAHEQVMMTHGMIGAVSPLGTLPEPPPDAQPPYFHMGPGGGTLRDHPNAAYADYDGCQACSVWNTPADIWAASGRHSGEDRCNCPVRAYGSQSQLTRIAEDIFLFGVDHIKPSRCLSINFAGKHGTLVLQLPTSLQCIFWVKCLLALKRYQTITPTVRPYLRITEYFYASLDGIAASRKIDDLFSLLPSRVKTQFPGERDVWGHLLMNAVALPQTGTQFEAIHGKNPVLLRCSHAIAAEAKSGPGSPLELLCRAYQRGALKLSLHPFSYAIHAQFLLFRRLLIAGTHAAVVNLTASVDGTTGKSKVSVSPPRVFLLSISPDLKSFIFSNDINQGLPRGTTFHGAPISTCCGLLDGSQSPLYCQTRYPMTVRFVGTDAVKQALGPLLSLAEVSDMVKTPSTHTRSHVSSSSSRQVRRLAAEAAIPLINCEFGPPHEKHYDVHIVLPEFTSWSLWCQCARWMLWSRQPAAKDAKPSLHVSVSAPILPTSLPALASAATSTASTGSSAFQTPVASPLPPLSDTDTVDIDGVKIMGLPVHVQPIHTPFTGELTTIPVLRENKLVLQLISAETEQQWLAKACDDASDDKQPSATGVRRYFLTGYLSTRLTQLSPETVANVRSILRNNILTHTHTFNQLFRVSHIINQDERFGLLLLAYFRILGLAVVLRRICIKDLADRDDDSTPNAPIADGSSVEEDGKEPERRWNTPYTVCRASNTVVSKKPCDADVSGTGVGGDTTITAHIPATTDSSTPLSTSSSAISMMSHALRDDLAAFPYTDAAIDAPSSSGTSRDEADASITDAVASSWLATAKPRLNSILARFTTLSTIQCPHVIAHLGHHVDTPQAPSCTAGACVYMVTELSEMGSVTDLLYHQPSLPQAQVRYIAQCILLGLKCLHTHGLMHGELHVGHIFLNTSGFVKVGGLMVAELRRARDGALGVAAEEMGSKPMDISGKEQASAVPSTGDEAVGLRQEEEGKDELSRHQTLYLPAQQRSVSRHIATPLQRALPTPPTPAPAAYLLRDPPWLPPESTIGYNDTPAADVWAFGVILLQLCSGALTLPELQRLADGVCAGERCEVIGAPRQVEKEYGVPDDIARIVAMCLQREPALRPSIDELISMSFISGEDFNTEKWPQEGEMESRRRRFSQWMRGCARWTRGEVNKQ